MARKTTTYWKAPCLDDHDCYSLRARTKREVLAQLDEAATKRGKHPEHGRCFIDNGSGAARFGIPEKVEIHYHDQMDLIEQLTGEGRNDY